MAAVSFEKIESGATSIEIWTLDRPDKLNAINSEIIEDLLRECERLKRDLARDPLSCRGVIVTGAGGKAFAAGADISEMKEFDAGRAEEFSRRGQAAFGCLEELPVPTIAAIDGFALGGGLELAMACDILVASETAQFGQPEAHLGLIPGFGATARFVERLGTGKALELLYSGARIKAAEALRLGLVQRIAGADTTALTEARLMLGEIVVRSGPLALAKIKHIVCERNRASRAQTLALEAKVFGEIFESEDKTIGVAAFLGKTKAEFTGR